MSNAEEPQLEVLLPLYLVHLAGGKLRGRTRMQKLAFLAQQALKGAVNYNFRPAPFGPLSYDLYSTLEKLCDMGFVEESSLTTNSGNEVVVYELTEGGRDFLEFSIGNDKMDVTIKQTIDRMFNKYGEMPHVDLLDMVHGEYPEYVERIDE